MSASLSAKRTRDEEFVFEGSSQSASSSQNVTPTTKALRLSRAGTGTAPPLLCTLPPTCHPPHNAPTALSDSNELEAHYAKYHAHVCEERGCAAVFPNARLLELHQTECHDPLALLRKERGEKIFACHLESCTRRFLNPKRRRLHLIEAHGFPKEYFFAVTNKGVGGLLKKWGEGASMLRGAWKVRDGQGRGAVDEDMDVENDGDSDLDGGSLEEEILSNATVRDTNGHKHSLHMQGDENGGRLKSIDSKGTASSNPAHTPNDGMDVLANSMDTLSLVPPSIRFGRGGKNKRAVWQTRTGSRGERDDQKIIGPESAANINIEGSSTYSEENLQSSGPDPDISINIDAALEALKSEAPLSAHARNDAGAGGNSVPTPPGGRGRGGRGRGRGRGRGQGRRGRG